MLGWQGALGRQGRAGALLAPREVPYAQAPTRGPYRRVPYRLPRACPCRHVPPCASAGRRFLRELHVFGAGAEIIWGLGWSGVGLVLRKYL